jgi:hypothetical protein
VPGFEAFDYSIRWVGDLISVFLFKFYFIGGGPLFWRGRVLVEIYYCCLLFTRSKMLLAELITRISLSYFLWLPTLEKDLIAQI